MKRIDTADVITDVTDVAGKSDVANVADETDETPRKDVTNITDETDE